MHHKCGESESINPTPHSKEISGSDHGENNCKDYGDLTAGNRFCKVIVLSNHEIVTKSNAPATVVKAMPVRAKNPALLINCQDDDSNGLTHMH